MNIAFSILLRMNGSCQRANDLGGEVPEKCQARLRSLEGKTLGWELAMKSKQPSRLTSRQEYRLRILCPVQYCHDRDHVSMLSVRIASDRGCVGSADFSCGVNAGGGNHGGYPGTDNGSWGELPSEVRDRCCGGSCGCIGASLTKLLPV